MELPTEIFNNEILTTNDSTVSIKSVKFFLTEKTRKELKLILRRCFSSADLLNPFPN